jgi:hypothetical protein
MRRHTIVAMVRIWLCLLAIALLGGGCLGGSAGDTQGRSTAVGDALSSVPIAPRQPATHVRITVVVHGLQPQVGNNVGRDLSVRLRLSCAPRVVYLADTDELCRRVVADPARFADTTTDPGCYGGKASAITVAVDGRLNGRKLAFVYNGGCGSPSAGAWMALVHKQPAVVAATKAARAAPVRVPYVRGMGLSQAISRLQTRGLLASVPAGWPIFGVVTHQSRAPGSRTLSGSVVRLRVTPIVTSGLTMPPPSRPVPQLIGPPTPRPKR